jgi:pyridoxal phosphate enzyme (YggS family)
MVTIIASFSNISVVKIQLSLYHTALFLYLNKNNPSYMPPNNKQTQLIRQNFYIIKNNLPAKVNIIVASKSQNKQQISALLDIGHRSFGENYVQEALKKWPELKARYLDISLHLLGHLQTNKIKEAIDIFDVIETIDSFKLAKILKEELNRQGKAIRSMIQVNIGQESQKYGIDPKEVDEFIATCNNELKLPISGIMAIPPANEEPSLYFALMQNIARRNNLSFVSMGMSADYKQACKFGSTHVRIGQAIFGERL